MRKVRLFKATELSRTPSRDTKPMSYLAVSSTHDLKGRTWQLPENSQSQTTCSGASSMAARRCCATAAWARSSSKPASRASTRFPTCSTLRMRTRSASCSAATSKREATASRPTPSARIASNSPGPTRASTSSTPPQRASHARQVRNWLPEISVPPASCLRLWARSPSVRPTTSLPSRPARLTRPAATSSSSKPSPICSRPRRRCSPASRTLPCRSSRR